MKKNKYICNKKKDECLKFCIHSQPHEKQIDKSDQFAEPRSCIEWGTCSLDDGVDFKVRCIRFKEK